MLGPGGSRLDWYLVSELTQRGRDREQVDKLFQTIAAMMKTKKVI